MWSLGPTPLSDVFTFNARGASFAGFARGRFFVVLGFVGLALIASGYLVPEPWLRLWMAAVQSGTFILGGLWLGRIGLPR